MAETRYFRGSLAVAFALLWAGCTGSQCSGDKGKMCDFFPSRISIEQSGPRFDPSTPRLQFAGFRTIEGSCAPPRCDYAAPVCDETTSPPRCSPSDCSNIVFDASDLAAIAHGALDASDVRCRFEVSTVEGEILDIVVRLAGSYSDTACCCTTNSAAGCNARLIESTWYDWAISVNGVELGTNSVTLPAAWYGGGPADGSLPADGGAAAIDAPAYD